MLDWIDTTAEGYLFIVIVAALAAALFFVELLFWLGIGRAIESLYRRSKRRRPRIKEHA
jgi:hypothetical protein